MRERVGVRVNHHIYVDTAANMTTKEKTMPSQPSTQTFLSEVRRQIRACDLAGSFLVVAVSGGPDSLALVHALHTLSDDLSLRLHAAHLDHGLRPEASAEDADFVRQTMRGLGAPLTLHKLDASEFSRKRRLSLEDAARRLRYDFLSKVAAHEGADAVAVAHTLDDQAETVLMHILRGSGLNGLRGMQADSTRLVSGRTLRLFRPLLSVPKSQTMAYCVGNGLQPRFDESNLSPRFTRNRVRLDLMPSLEEFNPSVKTALARLAHSVSFDIDFIERELDGVEADMLTDDIEQGISLDRARFSQLHPSLQRHLLKRVVRKLDMGLEDIEVSHVEDMVRLMSGESGKRMKLPGDLSFFVDYRHARLLRADFADRPLSWANSTPSRISVPGNTTLEGWTVTAQFLHGTARRRFRMSAYPPGLRFTERFDADSLGRDLRMRTRMPGDRFRPLGMDRDKSLKDFMIDAHVPQRWRDSVPILESNGRIAWVVGWAIADWAKVTLNTQRVLEITFTPKEV